VVKSLFGGFSFFILFRAFLSLELCSHWLTKKQTLPLVGWSYKYPSVKYCDFLTPTNAVTENPQAVEKYYLSNRLGWGQKVLQPPIKFRLLS
jgi:hypothetical protein